MKESQLKQITTILKSVGEAEVRAIMWVPYNNMERFKLRICFDSDIVAISLYPWKRFGQRKGPISVIFRG